MYFNILIILWFSLQTAAVIKKDFIYTQLPLILEDAEMALTIDRSEQCWNKLPLNISDICGKQEKIISENWIFIKPMINSDHVVHWLGSTRSGPVRSYQRNSPVSNGIMILGIENCWWLRWLWRSGGTGSWISWISEICQGLNARQASLFFSSVVILSSHSVLALKIPTDSLLRVFNQGVTLWFSHLSTDYLRWLISFRSFSQGESGGTY